VINTNFSHHKFNFKLLSFLRLVDLDGKRNMEDASGEILWKTKKINNNITY